ncbi:trichohyalin isoform X2 [Drosophila navojoa]|uniref:trichohyalin isoform X2 n=1 Tax=Drosophila navojoa TaxID=7232 RepID=UPI00084686A8|nr:trichohyalin isoform X2 [Drosophila navojoa]
MANISNSEYKKTDFDWNEISVGDYNLDHSQNFFAASSNRANALGDSIDFMDNYNNSKSGNLNIDWNEPKTADYKMEYSNDMCGMAIASSSNKENMGDQFNCNNEKMTREQRDISVCDQNLNEDDIGKIKTTELIREDALQDKSVCDQNLNVEDIVKLRTTGGLGEDGPEDESACYQNLNEGNTNDGKAEQEEKEDQSASYKNLNEDYIVHIESELQLQLQLDLSTDSHQGERDELESLPIPKQAESVSDQEMEVNEILGLKPRLKLNWTPKPKSQNEPVSAGKAPRVYECKDVYQMKREMIMRQREEEERKAREFHSKPVPNFKALHKRLADTIVTHKITVPVTPETLKHSYEHLQRRKRREENSKLLQQEHDNARNLRRAGLAEVKPFQLRADQRVRERREYNNVVQCNLDEKKKQQDEQRKQREMEEVKELRKMTEFKARPNPFK